MINYSKLAIKLNSISFLLKKFIFVEASPWINLVRGHPEILKDYNSLFSQNQKNQNIKNNTIKYYFNTYLSDIFSSSRYVYSNQNIKKVDFIIITSHSFDKKNLYNKNDFYFYNLQNYLEKRNLNSLLVIRNVNFTKIKKLKKISSFKNSSKVLLPIRNNLLQEFKYIFIMFFTKIFFLFFKINNQETNKILKKFLSFKILSKSIRPLRNYDQFKYLIKKHNPKYIITTFEGHSWEFLLFKAAKKINPKIYKIGYQHSILIKNQNILFKLKYRNNLPDLVLTPGKINKNLLEKVYKNINIKVKTLGHNVGLNEKKSFNFSNKESNKYCFVISEGIISETEKLINFVINYSKLYNDMNFIIKQHPMFNFKYYETKFKISKYSNIYISKTLEESEINKSNYFIYRGTSLSINLTAIGLIPIYLKLYNDIDINPLYFFNGETKSVSNINELNNIFKEKIVNNNAIKDYAKNYFIPLNFSKLLNNLL